VPGQAAVQDQLPDVPQPQVGDLCFIVVLLAWYGMLRFLYVAGRAAAQDQLPHAPQPRERPFGSCCVLVC
jgi:hypothetical protein